MCENRDGLYKVNISKLNRIVANPGDTVQIDARLNMASIRALAAKKTASLTVSPVYKNQKSLHCFAPFLLA